MPSTLEAALNGEKRFESDAMERTRQLILRYYAALNSQNLEALERLTSDAVAYDIRVAERLVGRQDLVEFFRESNARFREHVYDIEVMVSIDGGRAAAEFTVLGFPLTEGTGAVAIGPGQTYRLPGGTFFEIADDRIARISTYGEQGRHSTGVPSTVPYSV